MGLEVHALATHDLVHVPPQTWHQFRATTPEPLGFLCLVSTERDKPARPTGAELAELRSHPAAGKFLRV